MSEILWTDKKRTLFGLPLSFTTYTLTKDKFLTSSGLFSTKHEEIRLYRIMDVTMRQSFLQKLFNVGTIEVDSGDRSTPCFFIQSIKDPMKIKDLISDQVEIQRDEKRVSSREYMDGDDFDDLDSHAI